ncbi:MAG: energy-coupling factor ABC transporter ATP-binding protein [Hominisplanchenecus sp.]
MKETYLSVEQVSFSYEKGKEILKDVSFAAQRTESIGIVGANGVGKSTLLKLLVGLALNFEGSIQVDGVPVSKDTLSSIRRKIGYVFQDSDSQLFLSTAYEDVAFAPRNYGFSASEVDERVNAALAMTGISHLRDKQIYKMSGGEKKLVSIATILSLTPDIILMDEPSIALDPKNRRNLIRLLNSFSHLKIIASHDLDMILDTCSRTIVMWEGRIVWDGPTEEILTNQRFLEEHGLELPLGLQKRK